MTRFMGLALACVAGCASTPYQYPAHSTTTADRRLERVSAPEERRERHASTDEDAPVAAESTAGGIGASHDWDTGWSDDVLDGSLAEPAGLVLGEAVDRHGPALAQATVDAETEAAPIGASPARGPASDAIDLSGELLVYRADFVVAVYEVERTREGLIEAARELGGFVATVRDLEVVVRVPAARFEELLARVRDSGDVLGRNVQVSDVGEEFRDLAIRVRNAEAMRERLEALLAGAQSVEEALAVERELQRITESIERMKGRQRHLADQIRYSTVSVEFRERRGPTVEQPDEFRLPFTWLRELGLANLMRLR